VGLTIYLLKCPKRKDYGEPEPALVQNLIFPVSYIRGLAQEGEGTNGQGHGKPAPTLVPSPS